MRLAATLTAVMIVAGTVAPWAALAQSTAPVTRAVLTSERIAQIIASPDRGKEVEAAGFKLDSSADFLRNPKDPRNTNIPADNQAKDVFVLKFVKP